MVERKKKLDRQHALPISQQCSALDISRSSAYRKAAGSIEELTVDVGRLVAEGRLKEIPGAGEAITKKITELVTTGKLDYYERLKAEFADSIHSVRGQGTG